MAHSGGTWWVPPRWGATLSAPQCCCSPEPVGLSQLAECTGGSTKPSVCLRALGGAGGEKRCWTSSERQSNSEGPSCTCSTLHLWLLLRIACFGKNLYTQEIRWDISLLWVLLTPMATTAKYKINGVPVSYKVDKTKDNFGGVGDQALCRQVGYKAEQWLRRVGPSDLWKSDVRLSALSMTALVDREKKRKFSPQNAKFPLSHWSL